MSLRTTPPTRIVSSPVAYLNFTDYRSHFKSGDCSSVDTRDRDLTCRLRMRRSSSDTLWLTSGALVSLGPARYYALAQHSKLQGLTCDGSTESVGSSASGCHRLEPALRNRHHASRLASCPDCKQRSAVWACMPCSNERRRSLSVASMKRLDQWLNGLRNEVIRGADDGFPEHLTSSLVPTASE